MNSPGINLEEFDRKYNRQRGNTLMPPLALTTIAGNVLKKVDNVEVKVLDMEFEIMKYFNENEKSPLSIRELMKKKIVDKLNNFKPDLVGISLLFSAAHNNSFEIANVIKEIDSNIKVVCGGVHSTFAYQRMLEQCHNIDFIFLYEADDTFPQFLEYLKGKKKFEDLRGIAWLDKNTNNVKLAPYAKRIDDLDSIPFPEVNLIPIKEYQKYGRTGSVHRFPGGDPDLPTYTMQSVRGCVASCTFCSVRSFNGKGVRAYSAKRTLQDIDFLYNELGIKQLEILDDDFTFDRDRTLEICNGLIKRNYDLIWNMQNGIRLGTLNEEILHAMVLAKCRAFGIGVESGNDTTSAIIRKPMSIKMLYRKSEIFKKYPILYVKGNYMVGFPFENDEQTMNTFKVAEDIGFDWNHFSVFRPLVGTPEFNKLSKKNQENMIDNQKSYAVSYDTTRKSRTKIAKQMQSLLLDPKEAEKYGNEIEKQMKVSLMHNGEINGEKELSPEEEEIDQLVYIKNLEINFLKNKNLNGLSVNKYIETNKGKYFVKLDKTKNLDRAINDFKETIKFRDKNHAIAYYCLAKAYHYKGDTELAGQNLNKVNEILSNPLNGKWVSYFNKLVPKDEMNQIKYTLNKNESLAGIS